MLECVPTNIFNSKITRSDTAGPSLKERGQKWEGGWGKERGEFRHGCQGDGRP